MASEIIKMQCDCKVKDIQELCEIIGEELKAEFLHKKDVETGTGTVILLAFEKMYFRVESYVSLTIMLTEERLIQTADIIGSGGGSGKQRSAQPQICRSGQCAAAASGAQQGTRSRPHA